MHYFMIHACLSNHKIDYIMCPLLMLKKIKLLYFSLAMNLPATKGRELAKKRKNVNIQVRINFPCNATAIIS